MSIITFPSSIHAISGALSNIVEANKLHIGTEVSKNECIKEIKSIEHIIKDISEQINFLALNATKEVENNGKYGKEFATIANEVKKIAKLTQKEIINIASKTIKNKDVQKDKIHIGGYEYNRINQTFTYKNFPLILTKSESIVLEILFLTAGTVSIEEIFNYASKRSHNLEEPLKDIIDSLRKKLYDIHIMYSLDLGYSIERY